MTTSIWIASFRCRIGHMWFSISYIRPLNGRCLTFCYTCATKQEPILNRLPTDHIYEANWNHWRYGVGELLP